jgi:chromate transport protein ChrA
MALIPIVILLFLVLFMAGNILKDFASVYPLLAQRGIEIFCVLLIVTVIYALLKRKSRQEIAAYFFSVFFLLLFIILILSFTVIPILTYPLPV